MDFEEAKDLESRYYAKTFNRLQILAERGEGMYLYGSDGKRYLDMFAGIAVDSLGHCHPKLVEAISSQAKKLMHTSNWLYTSPQIGLARTLVELTGQEKAFITNDGSEAVEAALKLSRKVTGRKDFVAMEKSFHGRTMGALSVTAGEKYRKPFEPLVPGASLVPYDDLEAVKNAVSKDTAAVIVEPVQGEAGAIMPKKGYLKGLRDITKDAGALLIVDEVQTGFGRTGTMFAFQKEDIKPDIVCMAKGMGGGFPIGAIAFSCEDFTPGQHGGTFVGNPLACAAASAVIDTIVREDLAGNAAKMGALLTRGLEERGFSVHGVGLIMGFEVADAANAVGALIEKGVLTIYSNNTVRVLPPLIIGERHVEEFLSALDAAGVKPR